MTKAGVPALDAAGMGQVVDAPTPERLIDWDIPAVRHVLTREDAAFYALSVGMGADPLDSRVLPFVDPWARRASTHPAMALVLGYPGFWLGAPEVAARTGVGVSQILHIEQAVELAGVLPAEASLSGETRVTGLFDRGQGRGALLTSERWIRDEATGEVVAVCRQTHLLRGVAARAPAPPPAAKPEAPLPPDLTVLVPTRPEQALLYRLNGDTNPLHFDPEVARRAGFERPILHGMCTIGLAVTGLLKGLADYDPQRIAGFSVRMSAPVLPGDTLAVEAWRDGRFRARAAERDVVVLDAGRLDLR